MMMYISDSQREASISKNAKPFLKKYKENLKMMTLELMN